VLIRPAVVVPVERYTPERKAEFLLSTATTEKDYQRARREVDLQTLLRMDLSHIIHAGVCIFDVEDTPSEEPSYENLEMFERMGGIFLS
jgi:hypothetical protein